MNDGGPAFPFKCQGPTTGPETYYGMTLRDYFAAAALQGLIASGRDYIEWKTAVRQAHELADAMLAEREKGVEK